MTGTHRLAGTRHLNAALPATGPSFFEHCAESMLPRRGVDLLLVEFAVNTNQQPAAFERLLRRLLALRPAPALLVVSSHVWYARGHPRRYCWRASRSQLTLEEPEHREAQKWGERADGGGAVD